MIYKFFVFVDLGRGMWRSTKKHVEIPWKHQLVLNNCLLAQRFPTFTVWQSKMPSIKRSSLSQYNPGYFFGQILLAGCVDSFLELSVSEKVPVSPRDPITF